MNLSRLKITEGDLIVITHSNAVSLIDAAQFVDNIKSWLHERQLNNVKVLRNHVSSSVVGFDISILSCIDIFESEILK